MNKEYNISLEQIKIIEGMRDFEEGFLLKTNDQRLYQLKIEPESINYQIINKVSQLAKLLLEDNQFVGKIKLKIKTEE